MNTMSWCESTHVDRNTLLSIDGDSWGHVLGDKNVLGSAASNEDSYNEGTRMVC